VKAVRAGCFRKILKRTWPVTLIQEMHLSHCADDSPIKVQATNDAGGVVISVTNYGNPIPENLLFKVFAPYWRPATNPRRRLVTRLFSFASRSSRLTQTPSK
jgi:hypothetical protein